MEIWAFMRDTCMNQHTNNVRHILSTVGADRKTFLCDLSTRRTGARAGLE